jgi:hypothetical protein
MDNKKTLLEKSITLELLYEILKETNKLNNEITRIRQKLDSELYKIGTKYELVNNNILVCKNKFKNSIRSYKAKITKDENTPVISFE